MCDTSYMLIVLLHAQHIVNHGFIFPFKYVMWSQYGMGLRTFIGN